MKYKLTFVLVAALTSTAFAEFQAPLPEFKNEKQLAEWRAEKASEASIQGYPAEQSAFYTGKPYLGSSGGYAFKYRSFDPVIARWFTEDPSGFPDGPNNTIYVNNWCLSALDPDGQAITLYRKPVLGGFGSNWHSYIYYDVTGCDGKAIKGTVSGQPSGNFLNFGKLKSDPNSDMASARNFGVNLDWAAAGWADEYCFYKDLIGAQNSYANNLDYDPNPVDSNATDYNSNGFIAGILGNLGIAATYTEETARGWSVPLPIAYNHQYRGKENCCE